VTLRARLTATILAVVLAPLIIGAVFVTAAAGSIDRAADRQRLDVAANALRTTVNATCDRLIAAAQSAAVAGAHQVRVAESIVDASRVSAVRIDGSTGATVLSTPNAPAQPWVLCPGAAATAETDSTGTAPGALAAAVPTRDDAGAPNGYAYAAQALDATYLRGLARDLDASVMLAGAQPAAMMGDDYVRTVTPIAGQPLRIAVSVPATSRTGLIVVVLSVLALAAVAAIVGARTIARAALRPLDELARAADQVAAGALHTRVPVRHGDEIGQVGAAFNRITHEMRSYADALTASRDQLRGNLDVLGATLSSTHDRPGILRLILTSAIAATGAARGVVLLPSLAIANDGEDSALPTHASLTVQCSEGFDATATSALMSLAVVSGVGLIGSVAATGSARCGRVADPAGELDAHEPRCETYLTVPLEVPPADATAAIGPGVPDAAAGRSGVLALYDRVGGSDFDETDLRTVRTFARHAAVAVDNVRRHDEAQRLSHTDPLTGLYNYRHLQDTIGREINRSARFGHSTCVLVLDLDRFKDVNDTYGHAAGDAVLVEFARRVSGEIRGVDLAFRVGGEEFVLLLPETDAAGGQALARRLGDAIRQRPMTVPDAFRATASLTTVELPLVAESDGRAATTVNAEHVANVRAATARHIAHISITVSTGVAVFPDHGNTGAEVLAAADAALYAAKSAGRDTYRIAVAQAAEPQLNDSDNRAGSGGESASGASTAGPPPRATLGR
jgi:two-component system cell cycle response regulator